MDNKNLRSMGTTLTKVKSGQETGDLVVGGLTSIGGVGIESEEIKITCLDSPDNFNEYIPGFKDGGEVEFKGIMKDETLVEKLNTIANSQTTEKWIVTYPSGSTWEFSAFIKSFKDGEKTIDGTMAFEGNLRISGAPTFSKKAE